MLNELLQESNFFLFFFNVFRHKFFFSENIFKNTVLTDCLAKDWNKLETWQETFSKELTAVIISCMKRKGGRLRSLSVSWGLWMYFPSFCCVRWMTRGSISLIIAAGRVRCRENTGMDGETGQGRFVAGLDVRDELIIRLFLFRFQRSAAMTTTGCEGP